MEKSLSLVDLEKIVKEGKAVVAYFSGSSDGNGVSWCPDCNDSKPAYLDMLKTYGEKLTISSYFIERPVWKDQSNEYRTNPFFKVNAVPTLVYYNEGMELMRIKEDQVTKKAIDNILADHL
eukprot:CAMPEP_0170516918 /NCGR_PEP_ID=MMETSP0209-20121228/3040_1 /TAXON_ID=665100 ORGANISM="Litonotus pictus, Strain P1" /NCGR_SAMPLE_ID=MMETSP0209 /ASSEMBLY_ACC=CAM_ASM_000301 /LENGTH=120 /DNA_ID=CAMNT_0010802013 /DNA_START=6 /DNA_END=368 /DNA_ORIENTATION=+